jgi:hypothetical protein
LPAKREQIKDAFILPQRPFDKQAFYRMPLTTESYDFPPEAAFRLFICRTRFIIESEFSLNNTIQPIISIKTASAKMSQEKL